MLAETICLQNANILHCLRPIYEVDCLRPIYALFTVCVQSMQAGVGCAKAIFLGGMVLRKMVINLVA